MTLAKAESRGEGRVLLLFDASPGSLLALQAARQAAGKLRPLEAIYIEESNWLRSAAYGFAAEVGALSGTLRRHDPAGLEQRLARRRQRVRRALLAELGSSAECRLVIRRGRTLDEALAMAGPDDLTVVGRVGYSSGIGRNLGSLAFELARRAHGQVLLSHGQMMVDGNTVAVLLDQPQAAAALLQIGVERALDRRAGLLLLSAGGLGEAGLSDWRARCPVPVELRHLPQRPDPGGRMLARVLAEAGADELLVSRRGRLFSAPDAAVVLARLPGQVRVLP
jgi:nucleotide-binding universal stress UspA family protein